MNIRSIDYFLTVAEELNFTRAAEKLYISQQALSSHIQRLEEEYHVRLFERKPTLRLTEEGKRMVYYCRQIVESEHNLRMAFSDISENCKATIRVGMSRLRGTIIFPQIYLAYNKSHPNITVDLVSGNTVQLAEDLMDDRLDLYMGIDVPENPFVKRVDIAREQMVCMMSRELMQQLFSDEWEDKLRQFRNGVYLRDIVDLPIAILRTGNRLRASVDIVATHLPRPMNLVLECDQSTLVFNMANQGRAIGIVSPVTLYMNKETMLREQNHVYVFPLMDEPLFNVFSLVYRTDYPMPQFVRDFVDTTLEVLRDYSVTIRAFSGSI